VLGVTLLESGKGCIRGDLYCEIRMKGETHFEKSLIAKGPDARWNQTFYFQPKNPGRDVVSVKLYQPGIMGNSLEGAVEIPLAVLRSTNVVDAWWELFSDSYLKKKGQGALHFVLVYPFGSPTTVMMPQVVPQGIPQGVPQPVQYVQLGVPQGAPQGIPQGIPSMPPPYSVSMEQTVVQTVPEVNPQSQPALNRLPSTTSLPDPSAPPSEYLIEFDAAPTVYFAPEFPLYPVLEKPQNIPAM